LSYRKYSPPFFQVLKYSFQIHPKYSLYDLFKKPSARTNGDCLIGNILPLTPRFSNIHFKSIQNIIYMTSSKKTHFSISYSFPVIAILVYFLLYGLYVPPTGAPAAKPPYTVIQNDKVLKYSFKNHPKYFLYDLFKKPFLITNGDCLIGNILPPFFQVLKYSFQIHPKYYLYDLFKKPSARTNGDCLIGNLFNSKFSNIHFKSIQNILYMTPSNEVYNKKRGFLTHYILPKIKI